MLLVLTGHVCGERDLTPSTLPGVGGFFLDRRLGPSTEIASCGVASRLESCPIHFRS